MNIPLSPCVPENLVSRDGFSRPVPRQSAHLHTQAESGAYLRDSSRVPRRRPYETAIRHRVSPEFIGSRSCVPMAFTAESPPAQGQVRKDELHYKSFGPSSFDRSYYLFNRSISIFLGICGKKRMRPINGRRRETRKRRTRLRLHLV